MQISFSGPPVGCKFHSVGRQLDANSIQSAAMDANFIQSAAMDTNFIQSAASQMQTAFG
jgi:hypothetical protein